MQLGKTANWPWRESKPAPKMATAEDRIAAAVAADPLFAGWTGDVFGAFLVSEELSAERRAKLSALPPKERLDALDALIFVQRFADCDGYDITDLMVSADDESLEAALNDSDVRERLAAQIGVEELGAAEALREVYRQKFIAEHWAAVADAYGRVCVYCGVASPRLEMEHVEPRRHGGEFSRLNIVPACRACNLSKRAKDVGAWLESRGSEFKEAAMARRRAGLERLIER